MSYIATLVLIEKACKASSLVVRYLLSLGLFWFVVPPECVAVIVRDERDRLGLKMTQYVADFVEKMILRRRFCCCHCAILVDFIMFCFPHLHNFACYVTTKRRNHPVWYGMVQADVT